ncbi:MAG: L-histidine N(alpha)-methyltransferase [Polyangiales bacterium]
MRDTIASDALELEALREGLTRPLREISAKYFYDDRGSALFEQITELDEYYPTRTEIAILERVAGEVMQDARAAQLVELGSGAGRKIRLLLDGWTPESHSERVCTMLDVNESFLSRSIAALAESYPALRFRGVLGDFTRDLDELPWHPSPRLTVFFAGTIGNLDPASRHAFFATLARSMTDRDSLLLGVDLVKDVARLERAYNDGAGVTAAFNKNALRVLNARYGADFDVESFDHRAFFDGDQRWIEMRLRARRPMRVRVAAIDLTLELAEGEEIRTEISCKFTRESLSRDLALAGLEWRRWHTDERGDFALAHIFKRPSP